MLGHLPDPLISQCCILLCEDGSAGMVRTTGGPTLACSVYHLHETQLIVDD